MPPWTLIVLGIAILLIVMLDVIWSTLSPTGAGPLANHVTTIGWRTFRALHHYLQSHRLLKINVIVILLLTSSLWIFLLWTGWLVIFISSETAVIDEATGEPAGFADRVYFVSMALFTLGTGDFVAGTPGWRITMSLASLTGLTMITLVITYLLPIIGASMDRRQLALGIWGLGDSPESILKNGWHNDSFNRLEDQLHQLALLLTLHAERHLAYPVLQFFHASDPRADLSPRLANLDDTATILEHGIKKGSRPSTTTLRTLRESIDAYLRRVETFHVTQVEEVPPQPNFEDLRQSGIPLREIPTIQRAFDEAADRRQLIYKIMRADGWNWGE